MENVNKIIELDISQQAGSLSVLRLSDYALVLLCGFSMLGTVLLFFDSATYADFGSLISSAIAAAVLGFAAFTGWRHVGVIDPNVWPQYRIVFLLLIICCALFLGSLIFSFQQGAWNKENEIETIEQLSSVFVWAWIGGAASLGWLSLGALRRMTISGLNSNVEQVLLSLSNKAGPRAENATNIRRINPTRGWLIGFSGVLVLIIVLFTPSPSNKELANAWLRVSPSISLIGFFLLVRARRYFQVDADSLLAVDHRPPILFLRSFDDDEKQTYTGSDSAFLDFSLETRLSNHFSRFGPFIAVGRSFSQFDNSSISSESR